MVLDSEIHNSIAENIIGNNYLRINSPLGDINRMLDDSSEENIEKIHRLGLYWWELYGKDVIKFIND